MCSATQPTVTPLLSFLGPELPQAQVDGLVRKWRGVSEGGRRYELRFFLTPSGHCATISSCVMGAGEQITPGPANLGLSGFMALMAFRVRLEWRGTLKDTCKPRGPNGIEKRQGGSRVSLEEDGNGGANARNTVVSSWECLRAVAGRP